MLVYLEYLHKVRHLDKKFDKWCLPKHELHFYELTFTRPATSLVWNGLHTNRFFCSILQKTVSVEMRWESSYKDWCGWQDCRTSGEVAAALRAKLARSASGVDVIIIIIFYYFCQFSAKKLAFHSKTNVTNKFLQKLALVWAKNGNNVAESFGKNIFKIITSVPALSTEGTVSNFW
jgi:hypothetical protein